MMRAEPYEDCDSFEIVLRVFIGSLKTIIDQNRSLSHALQSVTVVNDPISKKMKEIRALPVLDRLSAYPM
jgi:hypothetical protein